MIGFIKYNRSEQAENLESRPNENHLLSVIARRVSRTGNPVKGVKIGEALVGDYEKMGLKRQPYRTALANLQKWGYITTRVTNRTTYARLCNSDVYDCNILHPNHQTNPKKTTDQPNPNHNQEDKNKELKNKEERKHPHLFKMKQTLKGELIQRTQLDKNFNFGLFPEEWSDNFRNEILGYFRYMEQKKTDRWGVLGTISSQLSVLKSYCQQFSEKEIIAALKETQLKGNTSYNPEWTKNRNKNKTPETPTTNFSLDSINTYQ